MNLQIEKVKISSLISDPSNARLHDKKNLEAIAGSLKLFGQRKPIVITEANLIVAGNGTVDAAKELGWQEIMIVRTPSEWSHEQVKAFALADNRTAELAEWNASILSDQLLELDSTGWDLADFGFEPLSPPTADDWSNALDNSLTSQPEFRQWTFSLSPRQYEIVNAAIKKAREEAKSTDNENGNANSLTEICEKYVG
jgi:site-specific DNA-methyltransferase (adenine-specific)